jgi:hypothetical protein
MERLEAKHGAGLAAMHEPIVLCSVEPDRAERDSGSPGREWAN